MGRGKQESSGWGSTICKVLIIQKEKRKEKKKTLFAWYC